MSVGRGAGTEAAAAPDRGAAPAAAALLVLSLAAAGCGEGREGEPRPPEVEYGEDVCAQCGMIVSDPRFASALTLGSATGELRSLVFDDVGGPFLYLGEHPGVDVAARWVHDCATGGWIRAETAFYVRAPGIRTPMAHGVLPCATRAAADSVARERGGEVRTWAELQELARRGGFRPGGGPDREAPGSRSGGQPAREPGTTDGD